MDKERRAGGGERFNKLVTSERKVDRKKGECQRRRREMPPDRRSSGKQKRLHTLLCLICLRVLSTAGSVSVTPFPPSPLAALPPPHPTISSAPPSHPFAACCGPRYQARADVRGPVGAGGPETEADSAAEAASTQAVGTTDPAHLDPVAPHVHHENTRSGEDMWLIH